MTTPGVSLNEIVPGLVLHLEPDVLSQGGGTSDLRAHRRVVGPHFFVCVAVKEDGSSRWVPLFSSSAIGSAKLPRAAKRGHPKWTKVDTYFHPAQVWDVPVTAIPAAATTDLSRPGARNTVDLDAVADIDAASE